ncbi:MAG: hypothetical protein DRH26_04520 [Deltaproteobacteria bacterium]|nr:MAG: hypothetical protein DRH26_04520 [Deltaproteobacteria bacterium]
MYISNQEIQKIKNVLRTSNLTVIVNWFQHKKYSPEILTKVILRNAWLMKPIHYKKMNALKPIFESCKPKLFLEIAEEIIENKIDAPFDLKRILEPLYYRNIPVEKCEKILEDGHNDFTILKICFHRTIRDISSSNELYRRAKEYFRRYPKLQENIGAIDVTHLEENQQAEFVKTIFIDEILSFEEPQQVWLNTFNRFGKTAFDLAIAYFINYSEFKDPNQKKIINGVIARTVNTEKANRDYFVRTLVILYRKNPVIRFSLIFGVRRIHDPHIAKKLIQEFQAIGIPDVSVMYEIRDEILSGTKNELIIESVEDIYDEIRTNSANNHLRYVSQIFNQKDRNNFRELFKTLLSEYGDEEIVQDFIIEVLRRQNSSYYLNIALDYWNEGQDEAFKRKLLNLIKARQFRSEAVRTFLCEHDFQLHSKIYGRA